MGLSKARTQLLSLIPYAPQEAWVVWVALEAWEEVEVAKPTHNEQVDTRDDSKHRLEVWVYGVCNHSRC